MNNKTKSFIILISIASVMILAVLIYRSVYDEKYTIKEYFNSLTYKKYNKTFDLLYSIREPYNNKENFLVQMNTINKNKKLYENSYLELLQGSEIKEMKICQIGYSKPEENEYLNDNALLELGAWVSHEEFDKKISALEYFGQFGVKITIKDHQGKEKTFNTVVGLKKSDGILEKLFTKYKVVDPCLLRTIWIYTEPETEVYIDDLKAYKVEGLNTFTAYEVLPGTHNVRLCNPKIGNYKKEIVVKASLLEPNQYDLGRVKNEPISQ